MSEYKLKIGITQGDPNGIGWEVILKALSDPRMTELFTPVVYGSPAAAAYYRNTLGDTEPVAFNTVPAARDARRGKANLVVCGEAGQPEPGKASPQAGRAAVEALRTATQDLKEGTLDAIVTAPFNKESVQGDDFSYTGHTEFFGAELGGEPMMILCSDVLRVGLVTKHIPVSEISRSISREKIVHDLHTLRRSLIEDFGIVEPRIAVMALNPHAGDGGLLGREEEETIRPAIVEAFNKGILAFGPFAADGLFAGGGYARYDGILASAPGFNLPKAAVQHAWDIQAWRSVDPDIRRAFSPADLKLVADRVLARCDALDLLVDGIVADTARCQQVFKLAELQCSGSKTDGCLSVAQVAALQRSQGGPRNSRGQQLYSDWPVDSGMASGGWRPPCRGARRCCSRPCSCAAARGRSGC